MPGDVTTKEVLNVSTSHLKWNLTNCVIVKPECTYLSADDIMIQIKE